MLCSSRGNWTANATKKPWPAINETLWILYKDCIQNIEEIIYQDLMHFWPDPILIPNIDPLLQSTVCF
jgi:hypothetical protein